MRIRTFRIDLGKKLSSGLEHSIGGGSRFCVRGSRVFQEIWVADFADGASTLYFYFGV